MCSQVILLSFTLYSDENEVHIAHTWQYLINFIKFVACVTLASQNSAKKGRTSTHQCGAKWICGEYPLRNHHANFHALLQF